MSAGEALFGVIDLLAQERPLGRCQLDAIKRLCQPLALPCRDALLRILAYELRGRREIGDGELHRIARTIIKDNRLFDPPDLDGRMPRVSKWGR